jgi:hypothetical protein
MTKAIQKLVLPSLLLCLGNTNLILTFNIHSVGEKENTSLPTLEFRVAKDTSYDSILVLRDSECLFISFFVEVHLKSET